VRGLRPGRGALRRMLKLPKPESLTSRRRPACRARCRRRPRPCPWTRACSGPGGRTAVRPARPWSASASRATAGWGRAAGRRAHAGRSGGWCVWHPCPGQPRRRAPSRPAGARATARATRSMRSSVSVCVVQQFQPHGQAALAGAMPPPAWPACRRRTASPRAPARGSHAARPPGVVRDRRHHQRQVAQHRLLARHGLETGTFTRRARRPGRARTAPAPAAARRPGASAGAVRPHGRGAAVDLDAAQRPGCSAGCVGRHEARAARRQQRLDVALDVEEVDRALALAPLQRRRPAVGQARHAQRLRTPATVSGPSATVASRRNTRPISNTRTRVALRARLCAAPDQAADQAGAHHRQRRGDGVQHADRVGVAGQFALPAFLDEAEVDGLLVAQRRQRVAQRSALRRASGARARHRRQRRRGRAACRSR
jgi:hypothetical protein